MNFKIPSATDSDEMIDIKDANEHDLAGALSDITKKAQKHLITVTDEEQFRYMQQALNRIQALKSYLPA